jgi:Xaa-Pro dipeptidase
VIPGPPPQLDASHRAELVGERLDAVRRRIAEGGSAGALLATRRDVAWLTVGGEHHVVLASEDVVAPLLVTSQDALVLAPTNEVARIGDEEVAGLPLELVEVPWHEPGAIHGEAERRLDGARLLDGEAVDDLLAPLRARLTPAEHDRMRWLGRCTGAALDSATLAAVAGRTEAEIAATVLGPLAAAGVRAPVVLAAADDRLRYRHPLPTDRPLERRLMLVLVAERWGLHVAATRLVDVEEPEPELRDADETVQRVLAAMTAATRPGATLGDVFEAARAAYAAAGLPDEWRLHHQGGTIGYAPRERIALPDDPTVLEPGMALAWNPSLPGTKAEATLLVGDEEAERIVG